MFDLSLTEQDCARKFGGNLNEKQVDYDRDDHNVTEGPLLIHKFDVETAQAWFVGGDHVDSNPGILFAEEFTIWEWWLCPTEFP